MSSQQRFWSFAVISLLSFSDSEAKCFREGGKSVTDCISMDGGLDGFYAASSNACVVEDVRRHTLNSCLSFVVAHWSIQRVQLVHHTAINGGRKASVVYSVVCIQSVRVSVCC